MLMQPQQIHSYLRRFFTENKCRIINDQAYYIQVQLTVEMDKRIMNRPYYWQYIESINEEPSPAQLTFITDYNQVDKSVRGEVVHIGSARLTQLFQVTKELGSFVQMFERVTNNQGEKTILTPYLAVNYKISYYSDQTKEVFYSLGINLMTGNVSLGFQESLVKLNLSESSTGNIFQLPYVIKPERALERLDGVIEKFIQDDDHSWATEAMKRWEKDSQVLEYFYEGQDNKPERYEVEKKAMAEQYKARINIDVINGGLYYLK